MENLPTKVEEQWKPIIDFPKYEISNFGEVRSFWGIKPRILKAIPDRKDGYALVTLCNKNGRYNVRIHNLVLTAFCGLRPNGCVPNHKNLNKMNNHISNLEWVTQARNVQHAYEEQKALGPRGEKNGMSKLKESEVWLIRHLCKFAIKRYLIAKMFRVSQATISMIAHNLRWREI